MHSIDRSMCDVPLRACRAQLGMPGTRRRREISLSQMQTTAPCSAFRPTGKTDRQPMDCCCRRISQTCINVGRHVTGPEGNPGLADGVATSPADWQTATRPAPVSPLRLESHRRCVLRAGRPAHVRESGTRIALIQSDPQCGRPTEP